MVCCLNTYVAVAAAIAAIILLLKAYQKYLVGWSKSKTSLVGKTVIVTGANTGIGYEAALDFAKRGARVILACRDQNRAEAARSKIVEETSNQNVFVKILDLASFASVRKFAEDVRRNEARLDVLVNNAGLGGLGDVKSEDGHNLVIQINHLSHFLLTHLLIDLLKESGPSRVVNVSSGAGKRGKLNFSNINEAKFPLQLYSNSKLCNILFTIELAERLKGSGVTTYSLHPGVVRTEFDRNVSGILYYVFNAFTFFMKDCEEGAQTTIYTAVAKGVEGESGEHFVDCRKVKRYSSASDPGHAKKLWEISEGAVKLKPEDPKI